MRLLPIAVLAMSLSAEAADVRVDVVDTHGAPLADVVVSLHDGVAHELDAAQLVRIDQVDRRFEPRVEAVQAGTVIEFPNSDDVRHHVYSFSHPNQFELKLYRGHEAPPVAFAHPGLVTLGCNIHDGMVGQVRVLDTPWFGTTRQEGRVGIDDVPGGSYDVELWHPSLDAARTVERISLDASAIELRYVLDVDAPGASTREPAPSSLQSLFGD